MTLKLLYFIILCVIVMYNTITHFRICLLIPVKRNLYIISFIKVMVNMTTTLMVEKILHYTVMEGKGELKKARNDEKKNIEKLPYDTVRMFHTGVQYQFFHGKRK